MHRELLRVAKFAVASGLGFLVSEIVVTIGLIILYDKIEIPSIAFSSATLVELDALAFGLGATVAFAINDRVTVDGQGGDGRRLSGSPLVRWCKYQASSLLGNLAIIAVQLALLATTSLSPIFGSVVGALVSYPFTYLIAMHFVWGASPLRGVQRAPKKPHPQTGQR
jgi:putative flippase GtrA